MTGPQADRDRRLAFAIPPIAEAREETQWLDPTDADDRALLIAAAHPELDSEAETALVNGHEINPRLHLTIHEIVATQIVDDDPPEVWATAQRLRKLGYGRHAVLHMLGAAMTPQLWDALQNEREYDLQAHRAALAALPECGSGQDRADRLLPRREPRTRSTPRSGAKPNVRRAAVTGGADRSQRACGLCRARAFAVDPSGRSKRAWPPQQADCRARHPHDGPG